VELVEALEIVVARTGHERYRTLVRERPDYAALVLALAGGTELAATVAPGAVPETPPTPGGD
jgi:hypothetical protein